MRGKGLIELSLILLGLSSCGGGGNGAPFAETGAFTREVRVDPAEVRVGDTTSIQVEFEPAYQNDFQGDSSVQPTGVVVLFPPGVDFVAESSEFDGDIKDGFERRPPNTVTLCEDGSRALSYAFGDGELSDLGSDRIRLQGRAFEARGTVRFTAETSSSSFGDPCDAISPQSDTLVILD